VDKDGKPVVPLTSSERLLLEWLLKDDGQYGECHGTSLDVLIAKGYATVGDAETGLNNGFIAKGAGIMYRTVSITDAGRVALQDRRFLMSKEELIKRAKLLLQHYEKATGSRKESLAFYLRKMHRDLVNAEDRT
jgi:hypothetical protein